MKERKYKLRTYKTNIKVDENYILVSEINGFRERYINNEDNFNKIKKEVLEQYLYEYCNNYKRDAILSNTYFIDWFILTSINIPLMLKNKYNCFLYLACILVDSALRGKYDDYREDKVHVLIESINNLEDLSYEEFNKIGMLLPNEVLEKQGGFVKYLIKERKTRK